MHELPREIAGARRLLLERLDTERPSTSQQERGGFLPRRARPIWPRTRKDWQLISVRHERECRGFCIGAMRRAKQIRANRERASTLVCNRN